MISKDIPWDFLILAIYVDGILLIDANDADSFSMKAYDAWVCGGGRIWYGGSNCV